MSSPEAVPYGRCHCGCGAKTTIAKVTNRRYGHVAGQPVRYLRGHQPQPGRSLLPDEALFEKDAETDCWVWKRKVNTSGYGLIARGRGGRGQVAHRYVYEREVGPIPDGMQLDHLCRNRRCVNPDHLEPVTPSENQQRGQSRLAEEDVRAIRYAWGLWPNDRPKTEFYGPVSELLGISQGSVSSIVLGQRWQGVA